MTTVREVLTRLNRLKLFTAYAVLLIGTACASSDNNPSSGSVNGNATGDSGVTVEPEAATNPGVISAPVEIRLVTISDNDAGWWIIDGESAWMSPECRQTIESGGGAFTLVPWDDIAATAEPAESRSCEEITSLYFAGDTQPDTQPDTPTNTSALPLRRGINLAGDFEVYPRGDWGAPIDEGAFARIARVGFDHVRIPIRWSSYTGAAPDYLINETFALEVDRMVELANLSNLGIVVNMHFFEELEADPAGERERYFAIWDQIARRYQNEPDSVVFELLNEPIGEFNDNPTLWNDIAAEALAVVRRSNPDRAVIIGPVQYNHPSRLPDLELPADDNIIATIHSYDPIEFTHQGAVFIDPVPPTGVLWRPDSASIDLDWFDRSWNTTITASPAGLRAAYQSQYAALAMRTDVVRSYQQLVIEADQAFNATAVCNHVTPLVINVPISFSGNQGTADISSCGDIVSLGIQINSAEPRAVTMSRIALCDNGCSEVIVTQRQALDKQISTAATWAANRGVALYLGEFGTLDPLGTPTDPQSRIDWTRSMRTISESYGVLWSYFAHDDEFGAYDRTTGQWRTDIVDALID